MKAIYKTDEEFYQLIYVSLDAQYTNTIINKIDKILQRHNKDMESIEKEQHKIQNLIFNIIKKHNLCKYRLVVEDVNVLGDPE